MSGKIIRFTRRHILCLRGLNKQSSWWHRSAPRRLMESPAKKFFANRLCTSGNVLCTTSRLLGAFFEETLLTAFHSVSRMLFELCEQLFLAFNDFTPAGYHTRIFTASKTWYVMSSDHIHIQSLPSYKRCGCGCFCIDPSPSSCVFALFREKQQAVDDVFAPSGGLQPRLTAWSPSWELCRLLTNVFRSCILYSLPLPYHYRYFVLAPLRG
jgi:hypothetical protein